MNAHVKSIDRIGRSRCLVERRTSARSRSTASTVKNTDRSRLSGMRSPTDTDCKSSRISSLLRSVIPHWRRSSQ
jgi:hypothetical protein